MPIDRAIIDELAPTGKLRAAINLGNTVLAQPGPPGGDPTGVSVELARELARRADLSLELVVFEAAGKTFEGLSTGSRPWDVAFLAIEPVRAAELEFSAPYVLIEGSYMVPENSPLRVNGDVDRAGVRVAVGRGSAYDLFLTRTLRAAKIVQAHTGGARAMIELFVQDGLEVVAGVRGWLVDYAASHKGYRVMDGAFMEIRQAMAVPKGRLAAAAYLQTYIEEMKASGFVADALQRTGQTDASVAPPG